MANEKKNGKNNTTLGDLPPEVIRDIISEQEKFADDIFSYDLNEALDDYAEPLTLKEKKSLKKYDLKSVDTEDEFDDLISDLAKLRGISEDVIENQPYSELGIWVRKVCYGTFNVRRAAKK